jgi:hypothetical protein
MHLAGDLRFDFHFFLHLRLGSISLSKLSGGGLSRTTQAAIISLIIVIAMFPSGYIQRLEDVLRDSLIE